MKWTGMRRSGNIQDRRGGGGGIGRGFGGGGFGGGGLPRIPMTGGGIVVLLIVVAITVFAGDPLNLLGGGGSRGLTGSGSPDPAQATAADMTSVILASTEDVWRDLLGQRGMTYQEPTLVLFDYQVDSACGNASSAVGPFYCPRDRTAYLDLTFFDELGQRFGAPGDFAQAYVVAHEIGHHVQNLLGVADDVTQAQQRLSEGQANALSVRLELQADFYAGVWAHHAHERNQLLEPGDVEEALGAATAIGDDRLQRQSQGHVVPDSFTHGTSEQRVAWFKKGFDSGRLEDGDTFAARDLARP